MFIATGALSCAAGAAFFDNKLESHDAKTGLPGDRRINKHEAIPPRRPDARGIFSPSRCEEWWLMINYLFLALCSARSDQSCLLLVFLDKKTHAVDCWAKAWEKGEIEPLQEQFAGAINCLLFQEIIDWEDIPCIHREWVIFWRTSMLHKGNYFPVTRRDYLATTKPIQTYTERLVRRV